MNGLQDKIRKGLPPPILLTLFLLCDVWSSWPALIPFESVIALSWRTGAAVIIGGLSLWLALSGLLTLTTHKTTLNALYPERTRTLVTERSFRFTRNPVYAGFVGLHFAAALLLGSVAGLFITPLLILLLTILHIQTEEAGMRRLFGMEWEQYCNNTPRWFSWKGVQRRFTQKP